MLKTQMEKSYLDNDAYGKADSEYTDSKAQKACITSLILRYAVPLTAFFILYGFFWSKLSSDASIDVFVLTGIMNVLLILTFVSYISSWVLMIKVRLRRREYRFGKVLMWLYIAEVLLVISGMTLQLILYLSKAGIH